MSVTVRRQVVVLASVPLVLMSLVVECTAAAPNAAQQGSPGWLSAASRLTNPQSKVAGTTSGARPGVPQQRTMASPGQAAPRTTNPAMRSNAGVQPLPQGARTAAAPSAAIAPRPLPVRDAAPAAPAPVTAASSIPSSAPGAEQALKLAPIQADVEYDRPKEDEIAQCKVSAQKIEGNVGWVVQDAQGGVLRRFLDTNGDNKVDQWCYFKDGLEVYRDIDTNYNGKADQYRWFNTAGSRWGLDKDEDGTIDSWAAISAEEVTAEMVAAMAKQDPERFERLLLSPAELRTLGLGETKTKELGEKLAGALKFRDLMRQQTAVKATTKWMHFSSNSPGVVPAGTDGSTKDVQVYENVTAIVQNDNDHAQLQVGTLIRVGDVWRAIDAPQTVAEGQQETAATGFFFRAIQNNNPSPQVAANAPSEAAQKILSEMEKLDAAASKATTTEEQAEIHRKRAELLERMAGESTKPEDRSMWMRQLADMLGAAVQSGGFADGVKRLEALFERVKSDSDKQLVAHVRFVLLSAEYGMSMQAKGADFSKIQSEWLKKLEQYVGEYPQSNDAAEAMLQLAVAQEFAGQEADAAKWYGRIVQEFPELPTAKKAAGARTRLDSVGKVLEFRGKSTSGEAVDLAKFRGQVVLIQYWATWCEPCKADMLILKELVERYGSAGFAVIGVNLDTSAQAMQSFLSESRLPWPQVYEEGGLDSRPAVELGILTVPTMILVDQQGRVVNRNISATELGSELKKLAR